MSLTKLIAVVIPAAALTLGVCYFGKALDTKRLQDLLPVTCTNVEVVQTNFTEHPHLRATCSGQTCNAEYIEGKPKVNCYTERR
ncbi:hypothetical protein ACFL0X_01930 [Nanoarchaeota archaeon]